jgi:prophage regulatory protein
MKTHSIAITGTINHAALLPSTGYLRLPQIVGKRATPKALAIPALIPIGKSSWWAGVRDGRYPKPVKLGKRTTVWRIEDIRALIERGTP